jgi:hypothetical protein
VDFENHTWDRLVTIYGLPESHRDLIRSYQRIHDSCSPSQWPYEFSWIK